MALSNDDSSDGPIAAINVTPLVDVMLVLLVIFMVTAPMMQQGVEVNLPKATTAALPGSSEQVVVSIDKEGQIFLGAGNKIGLDGLAPKVSAILEQRPESERKVYIKADAGLEYGDIMQVMSKLHEGGVAQIGLVSALPGNDASRSGDSQKAALKTGKQGQ